MGDVTTAALAGVIIVIGAVFAVLSDVIKAWGKKLIRRLAKNDVVLSTHSIFHRIENHLKILEYTTYSTNPFKQAVIKEREKIFWETALAVFKGLLIDNIDDLEPEAFKTKLERALIELESYTDKLIKGGVSTKVIAVMEGSAIHIRLFVINLCDLVVGDNIYDTNSEKLWVIFTIYSEYIQTTHAKIIDSLVTANGSLIGEVYNGIINEEDLDA